MTLDDIKTDIEMLKIGIRLEDCYLTKEKMEEELKDKEELLMNLTDKELKEMK